MDLPEEEDDMEYLHTTSIHLNTLNNAGDYVSQSTVKITSADGLLSGAISEAKKYVAYEHGTDRFQLYLYPIAKIVCKYMNMYVYLMFFRKLQMRKQKLSWKKRIYWWLTNSANYLATASRMTIKE